MTEETKTTTTTKRTVKKEPDVNMAFTPASWIGSAGVKTCPDCGEQRHSRVGENGQIEIFCPQGKDCAFVKVA